MAGVNLKIPETNLQLCRMKLLRLAIGATLLLCMGAVSSFRNAEHEFKPSDSLRIYGEVTKSIVYHLQDLDTFKAVPVPDLVIYNQRGEAKDTVTGMAGIPLKTLLAPVIFVYTKPKELNEFYFVCEATDGYRVVFSWNEIYNTKVGNECYVITSMKQSPEKLKQQRILFVSSADLKTGRRYIKSLQSIEVKRL